MGIGKGENKIVQELSLLLVSSFLVALQERPFPKTLNASLPDTEEGSGTARTLSILIKAKPY